MIAPRPTAETRGRKRKTSRPLPTGYAFVPRGHRLPNGSLIWSEIRRDWVPCHVRGQVARKASLFCAPIDSNWERPVDREAVDQRRPVGWKALGCAIIEQAARDVKTMRDHGLIGPDGTTREWPIIQRAGRNPEPARIDGLLEPTAPASLVAWWAGSTPEWLADMLDLPLDVQGARRAMGVHV